MMTIKTIFIAAFILIIPSYTLSIPSIRFEPKERDDDVCQGCGVNCDNCKYGVTISSCRVLECRKGPGDDCGGVKGTCGEGMICICDKCIGCSINTLECASSDIIRDCLPHRNRNSRYLNLERDNHFTLVK
ncbi:hypothetical protein HCN44_002739 [Aphidius gifuensis]|uniref:Uncharacterized protein n=1 Tax=Aphidius gifuensis TaxID=684658 RepID=A0A834XT66_APHGI|nr:single insulin-like growth factor-binding domain protein-2 [Aphidius gifuensis]XP_044011002.1 single insulin-like growth factor-binding domain protein-2 [Aphidius gifuensis]KAF7991177.1 hypothetical protein HCN44_002739 [Aphidius gifuensis]